MVLSSAFDADGAAGMVEIGDMSVCIRYCNLGALNELIQSQLFPTIISQGGDEH